MRKSISLKVGIIVAIVVIIVIAILSAIVIVNAKSALKNQVEATLRYTAIGVGRTTESQVSQVAVSTKLVAHKINLLLKDNQAELSSATLKREISTMLAATRLGIISTIYIKNAKVDDPRYQSGNDVAISGVQKNNQVIFLGANEAASIFRNSPPMQKAYTTGKPALGSPMSGDVGGTNYYALQMAFPLMKDGQTVGSMVQRIDLNYLTGIVSNTANDQWPGIYRLIVDPTDRVVVGNFPNSNGKLFASLVDSDEHRQNATRVDTGENFTTETYLKDRNGYALIANHGFEIPGFNTKWSSYVSVGTDVALKPVTTLIWIIVITAIVAIIIIVLFFYFYIDKAFIKRVRNIQATLIDAFAVINHEKAIHINKLDSKSKDELGVISNVINEAMDKTRNSLSKDSSAVSQALEVAKTIEEGNLSIRITKNPANPQLLELKDVLNNMLDVLETKIGSNMNEIERVFDSYLRLDFSTSVLDDKGNIANKGSVERVTNALGEEIRKMLKSSLSFASLLNEEAKKLNTQITNLSTSSNAQASSLEQSATAIEEITQSMQN
ncbi:methyl-accepting chemotaxis protein, partial [Helicobacter sp. 11S02629-2]|uniref:methyl-accepting chemotaxis protein n=1 Tax=Helicobacter sp. 11S02629-2 TaxID=1476195 RepID=UPI000BA544D2